MFVSYFLVISAIIVCIETSDSCETTNNEKCIFPFEFRERVYYGCTCDHSGLTSSKPWCSTKVDPSGRHLAGNWGVCGDNCTASSFDYHTMNNLKNRKDLSTCIIKTAKNTSDCGADCLFPFVYNGKIYSKEIGCFYELESSFGKKYGKCASEVNEKMAALGWNGCSHSQSDHYCAGIPENFLTGMEILGSEKYSVIYNNTRTPEKCMSHCDECIAWTFIPRPERLCVVYERLDKLRSRWRKNAISRMNFPGDCSFSRKRHNGEASTASSPENFSGTAGISVIIRHHYESQPHNWVEIEQQQIKQDEEEEKDDQDSNQLSKENVWVQVNGKWRWIKKNNDPCWRYKSQGWLYFPGGSLECQIE